MPRARTAPRSDFAERLARLRRENGLTQEDLSTAIGISRRALAYYETDAPNPPDGKVLIKMAKTLNVTVDQLLGLRQIRRKTASPREARLLKQLRRVEDLPAQDQKAVLRYIDALCKTAKEKHS